MKFEVIAQPGAAPDAVLAYSTSRSTCRAYRPLQLPPGGLFDAKLSRRWGSIVHCTAEFSRWWNARAGRPSGFFLEVMT